ncbi:MAG: RNA exonuclease 3 [Alyxoria varia]|nr:MAG: RNA exonuclease 3 [Alyxoria varia]
MFSTLGYFGKVPCPFEEECSLPSCMFLHRVNTAQRAWLLGEEGVEAPDKRRKVTEPGLKAIPIRSAPLNVGGTSQPFTGTLVKKTPAQAAPPANDQTETPVSAPHHQNSAQEKPELISASRGSDPPPSVKRNGPPPGQYTNGVNGKVTQETLNPRKVNRDPAGHPTRMQYLKKLHELMSQLNERVKASNDSDVKSLELTSSQLVKLALDEEQKLAVENPSIYANLIKLRMVKYKKMTLEEWKLSRLEDKTKQANEEERVRKISLRAERPLKSGLSESQEREVLRRLIAVQDGLENHGYVISIPTPEETEAAQNAVEKAGHWEHCERCTTRFQVFPERNANGALTSGGSCTYHHGRVAWPSRDRASMSSSQVEQIYTCCQAPLNSKGCTVADTHVFKVNDSNRLASIMQFENTPDNIQISSDHAVCFDCEMGFTVHGMELIRLTAISWPKGDKLLDVLVRPLGAVLDLNSRYSGVEPEDFLNAVEYDENSQDAPKPNPSTRGSSPGSSDSRRPPKIVDSPFVARKLLFKHLNPSTPLVGHAIDNDLNAVRIVHPCIIDTVLLFPHDAGPLPYRRSLKMLAKQFLWRSIQTGGERGHDSCEDAKATADLALEKVKRKWHQMKREGWSLSEGGKFCPPSSNGVQGAPKGPRKEEPETPKKRKLDDTENVNIEMNYD